MFFVFVQQAEYLFYNGIKCNFYHQKRSLLYKIPLFLSTIRSQKIKLSSASPIFAETDGEVIGYTPILFDIEPMAFCYFSK